MMTWNVDEQNDQRALFLYRVTSCDVTVKTEAFGIMSMLRELLKGPYKTLLSVGQ